MLPLGWMQSAKALIYKNLRNLAGIAEGTVRDFASLCGSVDRRRPPRPNALCGSKSDQNAESL